MVRLIYCVILLFILSGMYFVTQQGAAGLPMFLIQTVGASLGLALLSMIFMKKKDLNFFGSAAFFFILIIGLAQIIFGLLA